MELRLLSIGDAITLGPDPATEIRSALEELPRDSADKLPRAALIHDNGQDFIQFYATEAADPEKPAGKVPCQIQWCRHPEFGAEPEHYSCEEIDYAQVTRLFRLYAQKMEGWDRGIPWEPYKDKVAARAKVMGPGCGLPMILFGLFLSAAISGSFGERLLAFVFVGGTGAAMLLAGVFHKTNYGKSWEIASHGGGSCSRGCGSGCGGDGGGDGGGGDGGDGGGGGCGGGGCGGE